MTQTRRKLFSVISVVLSLLMVISVISFPTLNANADGSAGTLDDFVERCYTVTLDRPSDPPGFADWKDQLLNGKAVGIEIAYGFLFSREYVAKNKDNDAYLKDLYMLFMGREPDESGYNDWMNKLNSGVSRLEVFAGFANSTEFYNICDSYGITAGRYVMGYDRKTINNVNLYVERMYKICLGRIGDKDGQKNWVEKLITKQISGSECARSFIFSKEYINKGLSDEDFVENLYLAMFGRPSDADGKYNWLFALKNGMTRDEVFAGFANSIEFDNICKAYGINRGSYTAKDKGTYKPKNGGDDNTASGNNTLGEHTHVYGIENTSPEYLKSLATCTTPATYYYSCKCGAKGEETFTRGEPLGHDFQKNLFTDNDKYLKSPATCKEAATYYYACYACGEIDYTRTYKYGKPDPNAHRYDDVANFQKMPTLTEDGFAKWSCLNGCGNVKTEVLPCGLSKAKVGDEIQFGTWEQDNDKTNGQEPIDWIILSKEENRVLVVSKYVLDAVNYKNDTDEDSTVTWETSNVRKWLRIYFLDKAFNENEKTHIPKVTLQNEKNGNSGISGGNDTEDQVFILSLDEVYNYFGYEVDYYSNYFSNKAIVQPTPYAVSRGAESILLETSFCPDPFYEQENVGKIGTMWFLRTPQTDQKGACIVWESGCYSYIHGQPWNDGPSGNIKPFGVRPAMYIEF
ncbi:MAG: DUF4214 domain-containing protein [Lachnospiraceae bacterium]|nr:DUF4214 domain-containing protein [Lachnospiraceae bacterium]